MSPRSVLTGMWWPFTWGKVTERLTVVVISMFPTRPARLLSAILLATRHSIRILEFLLLGTFEIPAPGALECGEDLERGEDFDPGCDVYLPCEARTR